MEAVAGRRPAIQGSRANALKERESVLMHVWGGANFPFSLLLKILYFYI